MDIVVSGTALLISPLTYPGSSSERIYWLYLLSGIGIAVCVFILRGPRFKASAIIDLFMFILPKEVLTHKSSIVDYKYFFVSAILITTLISPILLGSKPISDYIADAANEYMNITAAIEQPSIFYNLIYTFCLILATDAAFFSAHYLLHKTPILWEFHKVHHSAEVLNPITIYRIHPVELVFTGTITTTLIGIVDGLLRSFLCESLSIITISDVNIFLFFFYLSGFNLRHSHVWLSYPSFVSQIFISPAQHQIHHSLDPRHCDKNFGYIFSFWDGVMKSLYIPAKTESLKFGLRGDEHLEFSSVWYLYLRPFKVLWKRHVSSRSWLTTDRQ